MFRYIWIIFFFIFGVSVGVARPCVEDFSTVYNETSSSVARIHAIRIDPFRVLNRVQLNVGAGVFIDSTRIVTNAHIVWGASTIAVVANDAQQLATVVGADPISDIAVIQIGGVIDGTTVVRWGNSDGVKVGQDVLAIGHPVALTASATRGIISGKSRVLPITPMSWLTPLIQTDAAIFPGNSGGPLVDQCGDVIGINSMILRGRSGINFAIPSNIVQKIVAKIIKDGRVIRPWHGIHGRMINATLRPILEMTYGMHVPTGFLVETLESLPLGFAEALGHLCDQDGVASRTDRVNRPRRRPRRG